MRRKYVAALIDVPQKDASLLVAAICTTEAPGRPSSSAGSWISPPRRRPHRRTRPRGPRAPGARSWSSTTPCVSPCRCRAHRLPAALHHRDPLRDRRGRRRRRRDLRVRLPRRGADAHDRLHQRDARGPDAEADRRLRGRPRWPTARTSTASTRARSPGSTPTSSSPRTSARCAPSTSRSSRTRSPISVARPRCSPSIRTPSTRSSRSIRTLGRATGRQDAADELVADLHARLAEVVRRVAHRRRPRVVLLEWTDPPFAPGHWIPEMIDLAGGEPVLGVAGAKSVRTTFEDVARGRARPDHRRTVRLRPRGRPGSWPTRSPDQLPSGVPVHAVDANAAWARPGPRLVDGIEELASILDEVSSRASGSPRPGSGS